MVECVIFAELCTYLYDTDFPENEKTYDCSLLVGNHPDAILVTRSLRPNQWFFTENPNPLIFAKAKSDPYCVGETLLRQ